MTETPSHNPTLSLQHAPSRARTVNSPLTHTRIRTGVTRSAINALVFSPGNPMIYEKHRNSSVAASPEALAVANQIWAAENKGLRPDDKFRSFIKDIRKKRKASKAHLRKTMNSFKTPEKIILEAPDPEFKTLPTKEYFDRKRKSEGLSGAISANRTKKLVRERNFALIQEKVTQMIHEDQNPDKIVKRLNQNQVDPSMLMQPRFQGHEGVSGAPVHPKSAHGLRVRSRTDLTKMVNEMKELKVGEGEVFLPGTKSLNNIKTENNGVTKVDLGAVRKYVHISKKSMDHNPVMSAIDVNSPSRREDEKERKLLLKIAKGEARNENEEDDQSEPVLVSEFIAEAQAMSIKKPKKIGANDRFKSSATIDELIKKGEESGVIADFNMKAQRPLLFNYIKDMYNESQINKGVIMRNPLRSAFNESESPKEPHSGKGPGQVPPSQLLSSMFSVRSYNVSPEMRNGELSPWRGFSNRAAEDKSPEMVAIDRVMDKAKHKRSPKREVDEREKYHMKVDTYVSPSALKKSIDNSAKKFYKEKVIEVKRGMSPNYTSSTTHASSQNIRMELYNEFQRLTTDCVKNVRSSGKIKRVMRKTFGNLRRKFGKMDTLITDRDVEFERQIKKDIRKDMTTYTPPISALLKMNPSSVGASKGL